jgi:hypothetical protein
MSTLRQKLETCQRLRAIASHSLAASLKTSLFMDTPLSEVAFRDTFLSHLREKPDLFPEGWYTPPPHGIGVLFGSTERNSRHNYHSLRPEHMWPKDSIFLDQKNGMAYLFASPVDRQTGIIGDFGLTLYLGNDERIIEYIKLCYRVVCEIYEGYRTGMRFSDAYLLAEDVVSNYRLRNEVTSTTDPAGLDYGHTIPGISDEWTIQEQALFKNADSSWLPFKNALSRKRVFISPIEDAVFSAGMAVTLEPRLTSLHDAGLPMISFHTVVVFWEDGSKELLTNFDEIFRVAGMGYMLETL